MRSLIAIGEALIDFIPKEKGVALSMVNNFERHLGGAPTNVATAYASLGGDGKVLTKLGYDAFGDFIISSLKLKGVDTSLILRTDKANTSLAFVSLDKNGDRDFAFYRKPGSDMLIESNELKEEYFCNNILHFCSVDLVECPTKYAHKAAIEYTKKNKGIVSFDPNLRFPLWDSKTELKNTVLEFISYADIIKVSSDEVEFLTDSSDIISGAKTLLNKGAKLLLLTLGADGAMAITKDFIVKFSGYKVEKVVDTTGAGDIFIGSFLYYFEKNAFDIDNLKEEILKKALQFACKASALSVSVKGANFDSKELKKFSEGL